MALQNRLNEDPSTVCIRASCQGGKNRFESEGVIGVAKFVVGKICGNGDEVPNDHGILMSLWESAIAFPVPISFLLRRWTMAHAKENRRTVLLLDEVDTLEGPGLIELESELRSGYDSRPYFYPSSVVLCGRKNLRGLQMLDENGNTATPIKAGNTGSPWNIDAGPLQSIPFAREDVQTLYQQFADQDGHAFTAEAIDAVMEETNGQPWLVNRIGDYVQKQLSGEESGKPVGAQLVRDACDTIVQFDMNNATAYESHMHHLYNALHTTKSVERGVRALIDKVPLKSPVEASTMQQLGITAFSSTRPSAFANRIYERFFEVALQVRSMYNQFQVTLEVPRSSYFYEDDSVNWRFFLDLFVTNFASKTDPYSKEKDLGLHMHAALWFVTNRKYGAVHPEMNLGLEQRADFQVELRQGMHKSFDPPHTYIVELKLWKTDKDGSQAALQKAVNQTAGYQQHASGQRPVLFVLDQRTLDASVGEKDGDGRRAVLLNGKRSDWTNNVFEYPNGVRVMHDIMQSEGYGTDVEVFIYLCPGKRQRRAARTKTKNPAE